MERELRIESGVLAYTVRQSGRARRMRITVHHDGSVVVSLPRSANMSRSDAFVRKQLPWIEKNIAHFKALPKRLPLRGSRAEYLAHKDAARALAMERVLHFNQHYGFRFGRISIKNLSSRWGSCSTKRNLNFHYRIALLPSHLADYVIAHELCHLGEFNHSSKFWALLAETIPDHVVRRHALRTYLR